MCNLSTKLVSFLWELGENIFRLFTGFQDNFIISTSFAANVQKLNEFFMHLLGIDSR